MNYLDFNIQFFQLSYRSLMKWIPTWNSSPSTDFTVVRLNGLTHLNSDSSSTSVMNKNQLILHVCYLKLYPIFYFSPTKRTPTWNEIWPDTEALMIYGNQLTNVEVNIKLEARDDNFGAALLCIVKSCPRVNIKIGNRIMKENKK